MQHNNTGHALGTVADPDLPIKGEEKEETCT